MKHLVCYDDRRKVLYAQIAGEISPEDYAEITSEMMSYPPEKRSAIVIDISGMKMPKWDRETRKSMVQTVPTLSDTRVALIGAQPEVRLISKVFISIAAKRAEINSIQPQETRFCRTEEEALGWLRSEGADEA